MSGVKHTALFERLMEIHSNSPKLYMALTVPLGMRGFMRKVVICQ